MALDFPDAPTVGAIFTSGGLSWTWDGTKWTATGAGSPGLYVPLAGGTMSGPLTAPSVTSSGGSIDNTVLGGTTPAAASFTSLNGGQLAGMRNLIINGDMRIDQRNSGATVNPGVGTSYVIDRWQAYVTQTSKWYFQRVASTTPGSAYALQATVSNAYAAIATDYFVLVQPVEGLNAAHLKWGTANAKAITVSGILNGSVTGSYAVAVRNGAGTRSYVSLVPVASANSDTPFALTVPGDTAGTWTTDTSIGLQVGVDLGSGSNFSAAAANTWSAGNFHRTAASVTLTGGAGASAILKDVQVEPGTVATPFERRPIGTELALCQRYYQRFTSTIAQAILLQGYNAAGVQIAQMLTFPSMRIGPTAALVGTWSTGNASGVTISANGSNSTAILAASVTAIGNAFAASPANGGFDLTAEL
jgi:hypothetical protein